MFNNNYMMENYHKNSLLGQLEENGIDLQSNTEGEYLPFGTLTGNIENSPFNTNKYQSDPVEIEQKIVKKRLNELDFNLFQEGNFININDNELSKDEKIQKIKKLIKKIDEKLYMLEDSEDKILIEKLNNEKSALNDALLLIEGKNKEIFTIQNEKVKEIADKIHIKDKIEKIENLFFKVFPLLKKSFLVKKALNKLVMLNESAKNLSSKQIPYGESEGTYNDFITYLSCANVIHAKLTKKM